MPNPPNIRQPRRPSANNAGRPPRKGGLAQGTGADTKKKPALPGRALAAATHRPKAAGEPQRIAKLLARAGIASRRDIERMIADGRIALDGDVIATPATLLTSLRGVTVDGNAVAEPEAARLFLFHKPAGLLTAARDPKGRATIYDRLPAGLPRVMPVGRLDLNTEGLLLLTTDGELKRQMELPSVGVERTYRARAFGEISQTQLEDLVEGITIEGVHYGKIDANLERRTGRNQWIEMTLTEGKNREVRRVLEHFGLQVSRLIRTRYGPFELGDLPLGQVGEIRAQDVEMFRKTLDKPESSERRTAGGEAVPFKPRAEETPAAEEASAPMRAGRRPSATPLRGARSDRADDRSVNRDRPARSAAAPGRRGAYGQAADRLRTERGERPGRPQRDGERGRTDRSGNTAVSVQQNGKERSNPDRARSTRGAKANNGSHAPGKGNNDRGGTGAPPTTGRNGRAGPMPRPGRRPARTR